MSKAMNGAKDRPRTFEQVREDELRAELDRANTVLGRSDLIHLSIETIERELLRRKAIEWVFAERARQAEMASAEAQRKMEAEEEKKREHERRMKEDPAYAREFERRESSDRFMRSVGARPKDHGPLPPSLK